MQQFLFIKITLGKQAPEKKLWLGKKIWPALSSKYISKWKLYLKKNTLVLIHFWIQNYEKVKVVVGLRLEMLFQAWKP